MSGKPARQEEEHKIRAAIETAILCIAAAIVLFMIGYSVYHAVTVKRDSAVLVPEPAFAEVVGQGDAYILPVRVHNRTRPTVSDVWVAVTMKTDAGVRVKKFRLEFLPGNGDLTGYVALDQRPTASNTKAEIDSFQLP